MQVHSRIFLGIAAAIAIPAESQAGWSCGIDDALLPQVYALQVTDGRLEVFVGPTNRSTTAKILKSRAVMLDEKGGWTVRSDVEIPRRTDANSADTCMTPPPDTQWLRENKPWALDNPYFEQNIGICTSGPGKRWGGISFYGGEGSGGAGGIVEQDTGTGAIRYYRPNGLVDYSTSHLQYFGGRLWIGTAWYGECGVGVGIGILSGEIANDTLYPHRATESCGFMVSDMQVHAGSLWIATELGLSRITPSEDRYRKFDWTNYVPTGDADAPMREVNCDALYAELLQSDRLASAPANDDGYPYGVLWQRINRFRPEFAWQYVRKLNGLAPAAAAEEPE